MGHKFDGVAEDGMQGGDFLRYKRAGVLLGLVNGRPAVSKKLSEMMKTREPGQTRPRKDLECCQI